MGRWCCSGCFEGVRSCLARWCLGSGGRRYVVVNWKDEEGVWCPTDDALELEAIEGPDADDPTHPRPSRPFERVDAEGHVLHKPVSDSPVPVRLWSRTCPIASGNSFIELPPHVIAFAEDVLSKEKGDASLSTHTSPDHTPLPSSLCDPTHT